MIKPNYMKQSNSHLFIMNAERKERGIKTIAAEKRGWHVERRAFDATKSYAHVAVEKITVIRVTTSAKQIPKWKKMEKSYFFSLCLHETHFCFFSLLLFFLIAPRAARFSLAIPTMANIIGRKSLYLVEIKVFISIDRLFLDCL